MASDPNCECSLGIGLQADGETPCPCLETTFINGASGAKILLHSGLYFEFRNPEKSNITIFDISHGLSNICRFTGQCVRFYSVAEHSVLCSYLVPPEDAFAALMHDAAEAVLGDVSKPLKSLLPDYRRIERRVERAIRARWGLPADLTPSIKHADRQMLGIEQAVCMMNADDWGGATEPTIFAPEIRFLQPEDAEEVFLNRYLELRGDRP